MEVVHSAEGSGIGMADGEKRIRGRGRERDVGEDEEGEEEEEPSFFARLATRWSLAAAAASIDARPEDGASAAGRAAEERITDVAGELEGRWSCFPGIRLPAPGGGRREVDLLVATMRGFFAVEIKNWSGRVTIDARTGHWMQTRANGSVVDHGDPVAATRTKARLVKDVLERAGVRLARPVEARVVLVHARCRPSQAILAMDEVMLEEEWWAHVDAIRPTWLGRLVDRVWGTVCSPRELETALAVLARLPTWDTVTLHGGRTLTGDFRGFRDLGDDADAVRELGTLQTRRETVGGALFSTQRSRALATAGALFGIEPHTAVALQSREPGWISSTLIVVAVPLHAKVVFRAAGRTVDDAFLAAEVDALQLSS